MAGGPIGVPATHPAHAGLGQVRVGKICRGREQAELGVIWGAEGEDFSSSTIPLSWPVMPPEAPQTYGRKIVWLVWRGPLAAKRLMEKHLKWFLLAASRLCGLHLTVACRVLPINSTAYFRLVGLGLGCPLIPGRDKLWTKEVLIFCLISWVFFLGSNSQESSGGVRGEKEGSVCWNWAGHYLTRGMGLRVRVWPKTCS